VQSKEALGLAGANELETIRQANVKDCGTSVSFRFLSSSIDTRIWNPSNTSLAEMQTLWLNDKTLLVARRSEVELHAGLFVAAANVTAEAHATALKYN
jgi:hypothetical protein